MHQIRKISIDLKEKIETGAIQFNDDWPGLFIRGDDCLYLSEVLDSLINGDGSFKNLFYLQKLVNEIRRNVILESFNDILKDQ